MVEKSPVRFPYLIVSIKLCLGDWNNSLKSMNMKVDKDNGKSIVIGNGRYLKFRQFSSNEFWRIIGCLVSDTTFGLGGSILWDK